MPWSGITDKPNGLEDGDNDTQYTAGDGLSLNGLQFALNTTYTDSRYWSLGGNTKGSGDAKLGTLDNESWDMIVNNQTVMSLEPKGNSAAVRYAQNSDPGQAVVIGERYRDNAIVAWGEVGWNDSNNQAELVEGFGVSAVSCPPEAGLDPWTVCTVTLNVETEQDMHLTAHVTPILDPSLSIQPMTAAASVVRVENGSALFDVYVSEITGDGGLSAVYPAFSFIVTGR